MPFRELEKKHDVKVTCGIPMDRLTTFRVGGPAGILLQPRTLAGLERCLRIMKRNGLGYHVLGRGSNLLVSDSGVDIVLSLAGFSGIELNTPTGPGKEDTACVTVGAGCGLKNLVTWCVRNGLGGIEGLAGIPGSAGGALFMNAGASGISLGDLVQDVLLSSDRGSSWVSLDTVKPGYRKTYLPHGCIVSAVRLRLKPASSRRLRRGIRLVMKKRSLSQPIGQASAGCIFRNFDDVSAGFIIDRCGLKGRRVGGAMISPVHANFIVNTGSATCTQIIELMETVRELILRDTGRTLKPEVRQWH